MVNEWCIAERERDEERERDRERERVKQGSDQKREPRRGEVRGVGRRKKEKARANI